MKFFAAVLPIILVAVQANLGMADTVPTSDTLPTCGLLCIETLTLKSTCSIANTTCICTNTELRTSITACVSANCTIKDALTTQKYSMDTCGVKPRDRTKLVSVVGVTFGVLAVIAFGLRIISKRTGSGGAFGLDDYTLGIAVSLVVAMAVLSVALADHGLGRDIWNVSFDDIEQVLWFFFWGELIYLSALPITKISILLFYLRIFPRREFKYGAYALLAVNVMYLIAFEVVSIWQCHPVQGAWKRWDGEFPCKCNNINLQGWLSATFNIILDLCILLLPMRELHNLSLPTKKKFQLVLMFCVGIFVVVVSCLRLKSLIQFSNTTNVTQDYVDLGVWSTIEVPVGIICACMPSIRSLFRHAFPSLFPITDNESSALSSMPKGSQGRNLSNARARLSNQPKHQDGDSFVQLVGLDHSCEGKV